MITPKATLSVALEERPALQQILPAFHAAFERIDDPLLGRLLPRYLTVADAARVAGLSVAALIEIVNLVDDEVATPPARRKKTDRAPPRWLDGAQRRSLDLVGVRGLAVVPPILRALRGLPPGAVLEVRLSFEPFSLVAALANQGWATHVTQAGSTFHVAFADPTGKVVRGQPQVALWTRLSQDDEAWRLDARGLPDTQDLRLLLEAMSHPGISRIVVLHEHQPVILHERLRTHGVQFTDGPGEAGWETEVG